MAKKRKKAKQKPVVKQNFDKLIKEKARSYPITICFISRNWKENGFAQVLIVRENGLEKAIFGAFLIDFYCLGVKDSVAEFLLIEDLKEKIKIFMERDSFIQIDTMLAQNIVYGAVEYAEDLGFKPNKEFRTAQYVLDDLDDLEYMEVEFGKDGKPHFAAGPFDNVPLILNTLNKTVGEGNYTYMISLDEGDFDDDFDDDDDFFDDDDDEDDEISDSETTEYTIVEEKEDTE